MAMSKQEFLAQLRNGLSRLPQDDIEEHLLFCSEMIEDRKEEGLSEEEAILAVGPVNKIVAQVVDIPLMKAANTENKPKRQLNAGVIALLALGSPIWLSLSIAAAAVILSLYISLWAVIISLWAVFVSFAACFVSGVLACVFFTAGGNGVAGVAVLATGIVCAGLSIFVFHGCKAVTKGTLFLTKKMAIWIKKCFIRREDTQ